MENNSDKQLRDKLSGTEFPFDPQAWGQMEAMLDEKKKRRVFFWWWTGGIAAALLLGVVGYEVGSRQLAVDKNKNYELQITNYEKNTPVAIGKSEKSEIRNQKLENTTAAEGNTEQSNAGEQKKIQSSKFETQSAEMQTESRKQVTKNQSAKHEERVSTAALHLKKSKHNNTTVLANESRKKLLKKREAMLAHLANSKSSASSVAVLAEANPYQKEIEMLNAASEKNISLDRKEASLLEYVSETAITSFDKKEDDVLPKLKKKIFNYSLGVLANVTGTTLGKQTFSSNERNRPLVFYNQPSYTVGFTHDFLFINRVAITNSILFSQTSFKVYTPKTVSFTTTPSDYTSHITELNIPIGIKVYPVVTNNFRFYINTGIINHIKLKETFDYTPSSDTAYNTTANLADHILYPDQTNFTGSYAPSAFAVQSSSNSTKDFSINSAKRYYASFYAGAGFEYIAKKLACRTNASIILELPVGLGISSNSHPQTPEGGLKTKYKERTLKEGMRSLYLKSSPSERI